MPRLSAPLTLALLCACPLAQTAAYRELQASFGELLHKVTAHKRTLEELKGTYQASLDDVDFHDQIQRLMQQRLQTHP